MLDLDPDMRQALDALCRRHRVLRLDVFGSAARGHDFTQGSDIDVIVTFDPERETPPFAEVIALEDALTALFRRRVDLAMEGAIRNPFVRESVAQSRRTLHAA